MLEYPAVSVDADGDHPDCFDRVQVSMNGELQVQTARGRTASTWERHEREWGFLPEPHIVRESAEKEWSNLSILP